MSSAPSSAKILDENALRAILDCVVDGIITIDERGAIQSFNTAAEKIFGYAAAEVVGQNVHVLMPEPYHSEHDRYVRNYLTTGQKKIIGIGREVVGKRKDGSTFPMDLAVGEFHLNGEHRFTGVVRDITERKRAEGKLREANEHLVAVLSSITDAYFALDEQWRFLEINPVAEQKIFQRPATELLGKDFCDEFPLAIGDEFYIEYQCALAEGRPVSFEGKSKIHDAWFEAHAYPRQGKLEVYLRDITERKRAEEDLKEADRRKDEFLAMLGHELRNPLAPIRNAVYLLRRIETSDPLLQRSREMIDRQVGQMARLVDDLLDVSRITRGKVSLSKEELDLVKVVQAAVDDHRPVLEANRLRLEVRLPNRPVWVSGDRARLSQIVGNLLHNANKFTDPGGAVTVELRVEQSGSTGVPPVPDDSHGRDARGTGSTGVPPVRTGEDARPTATIIVRDTGIGIEPATLESLFEPFAQAERSRQRSRGGLGLGLALVRQLARLHGGSVHAASQGVGRGSEFIVQLPMLPAHAATPVPKGAGTPVPRERHRVLIIEDNLDAAESIRLLLEFSGHTVEVASNGRSGLELAQKLRPEVVLCDIGLPDELDGYAVARLLRADANLKSAYLIAMTGYGQEEDLRLAREAGFDVHLTKPADPAALERLLANLPARGN